MAAVTDPDRRAVLIASAALAAANLPPQVAAAAEHLTAGAVAVFEADEPAARAFARNRPTRIAIAGDRVHFARRLFLDDRPAKVVGVTRFADFLLLSEIAREAGYRATLAGPAPPDGAALFLWTADRA